MSGIRINAGIKRIEVNDDGDYITLNFGDHDFPNRFFNLLDRVKVIADEATEKETSIRAQFEADSMELVQAISRLDCDMNRSIMDEIDKLFGPDTCRKVFGDIIPGIELFDDFFTQMMPYFEQYGKERAQRMSKYSAARTGNV